MTSTVYSDAYMVVVNVGSAPELSPWLSETTFLINSLGATTAMIAQTLPLEGGTTAVLPIPFTPKNAAVVPTTSVTTATSTSPTASTTTIVSSASRPISTIVSPLPTSSLPVLSSPAASSTATGTPTTRIAGIVAGMTIGVISVAAAYFFYRRASKKRHRSEKSSVLDPSNAWSSTSIPTAIGTESESTPTIGAQKAWVNRGGSTNVGEKKWDNLMIEVSSEYNHFEDGGASATDDYESRVGEGKSNAGGYHETPEERQERLWRLRNRTHSPLPPGGGILSSPRTKFANGSPTYTPKMAPLSILKRPPTPTSSLAALAFVNSTPTTGSSPPPYRFTSTVKNLLKPETNKEPSVYKPTFAERKQADIEGTKRKKGVRFGGEQIREFGRTPVGSRAASLLDPDAKEPSER
ncbi:Mucin-5B [Schaereria dolodes]|nr:Mucin-5B [Schaereria dolodes]